MRERKREGNNRRSKGEEEGERCKGRSEGGEERGERHPTDNDDPNRTL